MSIVAIISLVASIAPKLISSGISIYGLWKEAGDIINGAEETGVIDPEAYLALVNKCNELDMLIQKRAEEARQ